MQNALLLLFLDGVGIGPDDPEVNPFLTARTPTLAALLGGAVPTLPGGEVLTTRTAWGTSHLLPLDATLGVEGTPQSGTGQIALFTGHNAAHLFGRHFGPWPPVSLRPLLAEENLLVRALDAGVDCAFANAYPRDFVERRESRRIAVPPLAAAAAGLLTRDHESLARGEAVASEIENEGWRRHLGFSELPRVTPEEAGANLARIAASARLTLYAHYHTDLAGHRGGMEGGVAALERVDRFLAGILEGLAPHVSLLLVSDHGNIEDVRVGHTRNPALGLLLERPPAPGPEATSGEGPAPGPKGAPSRSQLTAPTAASPAAPLPRALTDVTPWILGRLAGWSTDQA